MTIDELREIMHQLKLDFDCEPQLIYVFYQTPDGLVNNLSISISSAHQRNRRPMTAQQLAELMKLYPDAADARLLAVEHPSQGLSHWIDATEACRRLCICRRTLQRWEKLGALHPSRVGRRTYYDATEIDTLLRNNAKLDNGRLDQTAF